MFQRSSGKPLIR